MNNSSKSNPKPSLSKNKAFIVETIYLILIFIVMMLIFFDVIDTGFFLGQLRFSHWMGIIGALFIMVFAPIFYYLKRRYPKRYKILMQIHVFGFTTSFLLVSIHLAGQLNRPLQFYPDLGAGLALYIIVAILVITGYLHRYHPFNLGNKKSAPHFGRKLHVGLISGLYIVIIVHFAINFPI
ncbi:MAG: hypothetical protein EU531_05345 [Promethearchaeota archaeon]|nr:MAG: hypothetical protein EU531_05345 [Candidatus Lokiarchaeota archaeon]